jgi:hypothetical protein
MQNIKLSQAGYIENILERFNLVESKIKATPMLRVSDIMKNRIRSKEEEIDLIGVPYREAIGALMYISVRTRPDISLSVCILAKHVQNHRTIHWESLKRIIRYVKGA